jgi:hypothetical protein
VRTGDGRLRRKKRLRPRALPASGSCRRSDRAWRGTDASVRRRLALSVASESLPRTQGTTESSLGAGINLQEITLRAGGSGKYEYLPSPNSLSYAGRRDIFTGGHLTLWRGGAGHHVRCQVHPRCRSWISTIRTGSQPTVIVSY